jgi:hypothetical protein
MNKVETLAQTVAKKWVELLGSWSKEQDQRQRAAVPLVSPSLGGKSQPLNKRAAMQQLLWEAIVITVGSKPIVLLSRSKKREDSKLRWLLGEKTVMYLLLCYFLFPIEAVLGYDKTIEFAAEAFTTWANFADRVRDVELERVLRLWDYDDFNSQHQLLTMILETQDLREAYVDHFADRATDFCALASGRLSLSRTAGSSCTRCQG